MALRPVFGPQRDEQRGGRLPRRGGRDEGGDRGRGPRNRLLHRDGQVRLLRSLCGRRLDIGMLRLI